MFAHTHLSNNALILDTILIKDIILLTILATILINDIILHTILDIIPEQIKDFGKVLRIFGVCIQQRNEGNCFTGEVRMLAKYQMNSYHSTPHTPYCYNQPFLVT